MSRDQKPGKVRHVGVVQDRRAGDAPGNGGARAGVGTAIASAATGAVPPSGSAVATAAAPAGKGGIGMLAILMFLIFAGIGGGGIVALAPRLGLWP